MQPLIEENRASLVDLCRRFLVRRLELFGSAATDRFSRESSDFDFLVEFNPPRGMNRADQYFGLLFALEELLGRRIDLVCAGAIRNRFFRQAVEHSKVLLYAA